MMPLLVACDIGGTNSRLQLWQASGADDPAPSLKFGECAAPVSSSLRVIRPAVQHTPQLHRAPPSAASARFALAFCPPLTSSLRTPVSSAQHQPPQSGSLRVIRPGVAHPSPAHRAVPDRRYSSRDFDGLEPLLRRFRKHARNRSHRHRSSSGVLMERLRVVPQCWTPTSQCRMAQRPLVGGRLLEPSSMAAAWPSVARLRART